MLPNLVNIAVIILTHGWFCRLQNPPGRYISKTLNQTTMQQPKTALITGGNDGIGKATATELARRGMRVIIACRNEEKARQAIRDIQQEGGERQAAFLPCDLASFGSIRETARLYQSQFGPLDVLINNAGIFTSQLEYTKEGFELQFGVNHLGHFLLTHLLMDSMKQAGAPRVVNVSSIAYLRGQIDFGNLRGEKGPGQYEGMKAYAQSKLANVLFTRELARRHPKINAYALHPGPVRTRIGNKHSNWFTSLGWHLLKIFMVSPKKGAKTSVYLATSPEVEGAGGQFFDDKQRQRTLSEAARDEGLGRRLWEASEEVAASK